MNISSRIASFVFLAAWLAVLVGCPSGPRTQRIEGVVTYQGKPLVGATVGFSPLEGIAALPAYGQTDENGRYTITALQGGRSGAGAPVGKYTVVIIKEKLAREYTPKELDVLEKTGYAPEIPIVSAIPAHYGNKETGFSVEVVKGRNRFDFELTDNP